MPRLSALDIAFLQLESTTNLVHTAGLLFFDVPKGYNGNFAHDLLQKYKARGNATPPFNYKLKSNKLGVGIPSWEEDSEFDFDYHIRHAALPEPGKIEDLLALVSRLHGRPLDRSRPLWEFYLIEGLNGGREIAFYVKVHHALLDGIGNMTVLESTLSTSPDDIEPLAFWQNGGKKSKSGGRPAATVMERLTGARKTAITQAKTVQELSKTFLTHGLASAGLKKDRAAPALFQAPKSPFNVPISQARLFAITTLPLARAKVVGKAAGGTINDVILACCGSAIRRYLDEKGLLPEKPMVATVPVSVRAAKGEGKGNNISYVANTLATDLTDPLMRFKAIRASSEVTKAEVADMSRESAMTFAALAQSTVLLLREMRLVNLAPPPANVTISNVPGPREQLYVMGARMTQMYPLSVLVDGQAINITITSYQDRLDFGLTADRDALPDVDNLARYIYEAFEEYERITVGAPPAPAAPVDIVPAVKPTEVKKIVKSEKKPTKAVPKVKAEPKAKAAAKAKPDAAETAKAKPVKKAAAPKKKPAAA